MAISGETLVVGACNEDSNAGGINGDQNDNSEENTGAAYVFFDTSSSQDFTINAGHTGAWFNPATSGQGQFIDVEAEEQFMFVSWFTFGVDSASGQRRLTAQGSFEGSIAEIDVFAPNFGQEQTFNRALWSVRRIQAAWLASTPTSSFSSVNPPTRSR